MRFGVLLLFLFNCLDDVRAADWGVHGALFPIQETSLLEIITNRVKALKKTGKLGSIQKTITAKIRHRVLHPQAAHQLPTASKYASFVFDPSLIVDRDYKDHKGVVFVTKGTRINPLDHYSWGEPLLLINGDDDLQVKWIKNQKGKIVLIQGSPLELEKNLQRPIYFDQGGRIVTRFCIPAVPAKISQQDKHLLVEIIPVTPTTQTGKTS